MGVKVVVTGGKIGELALHYANKYQLMLIRLSSKWDLRRLCKAVNATPLPRLVSSVVHTVGNRLVYSSLVFIASSVFRHHPHQQNVVTVRTLPSMRLVVRVLSCSIKVSSVKVRSGQFSQGQIRSIQSWSDRFKLFWVR